MSTLILPNENTNNWGAILNTAILTIDKKTDQKAPTNHTHADKAEVYHTHGIDDIHDIDTISADMDNKADKIHEHDVDNIYFQEKAAPLDGIGLPKTRPPIPLLDYLRDTMIDTLPMMHTHQASDIEGLEHLFTDISSDTTAILSQMGSSSEARSVSFRVCLYRQTLSNDGSGWGHVAQSNVISEPFLQWEYGYEFRKINSNVMPPVGHIIYKNVNANNRITIEKPMHSSGYWNDDGTTHLLFWCRGKHSINGSTAVEHYETFVIERPSLTSIMPIDELVSAMMKNPDFVNAISKTVAESYDELPPPPTPPNN